MVPQFMKNAASYRLAVRRIKTSVVTSCKTFLSAIDANDIFAVAGVTTLTVGISMTWNIGIGLIAFGAVALVPVALKLR